MKSNIKSKEFYDEAESIEKGWGSYLRRIDELKDKVHNKLDISLKDSCWILYAEGYCSSIWESFFSFCENQRWSNRELPWEAWKGLFDEWYDGYTYEIQRSV